MVGVWEVAGLKAAPGEKAHGMVSLPGVERPLPLFLVNGDLDGPLAVVTGGLHGCEYTSIDAAIQLGRSLEPGPLRGRVAVLPVMNVDAYAARSVYVHPADRKNLNRVFPGRPDGTESERLAFQVHQALLRHCDFFIDLHGGDMNEALVSHTYSFVTGDPVLDARALEFAKAMGLPYVYGRPTGAGLGYEIVANTGKVAILSEAGQQGVVDPALAAAMAEGCRNCLRMAGILSGAVVAHPGQTVLKALSWAAPPISEPGTQRCSWASGCSAGRRWARSGTSWARSWGSPAPTCPASWWC
jgi:hypothetical protein